MTQKASETHGAWIYLVPVRGLVLTDAVNNEFTVNRVTFMSVGKLAGVRKGFR